MTYAGRVYKTPTCVEAGRERVDFNYGFILENVHQVAARGEMLQFVAVDNDFGHSRDDVLCSTTPIPYSDFITRIEPWTQ